MTKHRAVVTGYDPTYVNPDTSTGRPKGVQTAADMRVATSYDVYGEGVFAIHGVPAVVTGPSNTIEVTPFMAAILSPNHGYYMVKFTANETVEINLANTGNVKVYVQQKDWEIANDVADANSELLIGVVYGATAIPAGAYLLFTSTLSGQTSTSGMTFTSVFKYTGAASGAIFIPNQAALTKVQTPQIGTRALAFDGSGEWYYDSTSTWKQTQIANVMLDTGWQTLADTWTYSSWSATTRIGVLTVPTDATLKYTAGMRVRLQQTTGGVKYGIITKVTSTTLTVFFPSGTTLNNEAITNPAFSMLKTPYGFDSDPILWQLSFLDTSSWSQSNPTLNQWYLPTSHSLVVGIGAWLIRYDMNGAVNRAASSGTRMKSTLTTTNTTETDVDMTEYIGATSATITIGQSHRQKFFKTAAQTTYYLNVAATVSSIDLLQTLGSQSTTRIIASCAYL